MKKTFFILLFLFIAAHGQQERVAIINTLDDRDSVSISELVYLTDRLRETAVNVLPKSRYGVMTTESIIAFLGSYERTVKECKAASCLAELGRKVSADYVAQARIGRFGDNLTIKAELYSSKSGNLIGSFTGDSRDIFGLLAIIDEKAVSLFRMMPGVSGNPRTAFPSVQGGISNLEKAGGYETGDERSYLVSVSTEPPGAALSFDGAPSAGCTKTPCRTELREGEVRIIAALGQHEPADTTVSIVRNNQAVAIRLKPSFGILEVKPDYIDWIGVDKPWGLSINGKPYLLGEIRLPPGRHAARLGHECYDSLSFEAGINKGSREVFDMSKHISLRKGGLALSAERNGEPVSEPVFVNGRQIGETPFSGSVPLCAKVEIGKDKEFVNVALKHNEKLRHTHKMGGFYEEPVPLAQELPYGPAMPETGKPGKASFWVAIVLDAIGAAFIAAGIAANEEMKSRYDDYYRKESGWESSWESVRSKRSERNACYTIGGLLLASGIGVHIWF